METLLHRILLVDDEPDIRMIARRSLEAIGGFTIEPCGSGDEALSKAQDFAPQLILMDVMMPGKDGPTTLTELRQLSMFNDTPVVFMTARIQKQEIEQYLALGATDVISKPFDPMTLSDQVKKIWASVDKN